jgi:hypothetical protein
VAAPVSAAPDDDGAIWLGSPDGDEGLAAAGSTYGSNVSIEDLLSAETDPGSQKEKAPAPEPEPEPAAWSPSARFGSDYEIDRGFDPEWATPIPVEPEPPTPAPVAEIPVAPVEPEAPRAETRAESMEEDVLLTEVASDHELFEDPSLDIARLGTGEQREILVPVQLGEGPAARRFKLSIRLRLDPID